MALINIGTAYIKTEDIQMLTAVENGTEEDKRFGIEVITRFGKYRTFCEGRTNRNEKIQKILDLENGPDAELREIRKQMANINARINQMDRKLGAIQKTLDRLKEETHESTETA